ncbi:MAG TPA: hypothetical protein VJ692_02880, partial [Nitrospiraceae bacterium]|nr:hypothetical protein [Nitrospiraceae bacterium]
GEFRHRAKDGTLFDVDITTQETAFHHRPAAVSLAVDLAEHKRAERALRDSKARLNEREALLAQYRHEHYRLQASQEQLRHDIQELELFHDLTVDRELKMMELERENARLKARLRQQSKTPRAD